MIKKNIPFLIFFTFLIFFILTTCNENTRFNFKEYNKGQESYNNNCISCHNTKNQTTFHPTLIEMKAFEDSILKNKIFNIKLDSNHKLILIKLDSIELHNIYNFIIKYETMPH